MASALLLPLMAGCSGRGMGLGRWLGRASSREAAHHQPAEGMGARPTEAAPDPLSPVSDTTIHVIHLRFDVHRVDLPIAAVRHSEKVWNHVDELRIDPAHAALLARNALRVGVADESAWPAIRTILSAVETKEASAQRIVRASAPLTIKLASVGTAEAFFRYDRGAALVGGTLEGGQKVVCVDYEWHPQRHSRTTVRISFEVIRDPDAREWNVLTGRPAAPGDVVFNELSCAFTLSDGEFVVIGAGDALSNPYLVGSRFLTRQTGGQRYETLLFITPQPVRSSVETR